jgi:diguanylate cyclase (GGDEF)-like protein
VKQPQHGLSPHGIVTSDHATQDTEALVQAPHFQRIAEFAMDYHTGLLVIGMQQLLYFVGWLMAAHLIPPMRQIAIRWSLFALFLASFFFLNTSGQALNVNTDYLSVISLLASVIMARRASEYFFSLKVQWREDIPFFAGILLLLYLSHQLSSHEQQVCYLLTISCLGLAWLITRAVMTAHEAMAKEFGNSIAMILHGPSLLLAITMLVQAALLQGKTSMVMDVYTGQSNGISYLLLMLVATGFTHIFYVILIVKRLFLQMEIQTKQDPLTDLLNRRGMQEILDQQMEAHFRCHDPCSILMLDIDHFKRINDEQGHDKGDDVLRQVAKIIKATVRTTDQVARIGGEEFLVILPNTPIALATEMAERLRSMIERRSLDMSGGPITVSIGVTQAIPEDNEQNRLLIRADHALYQSKKQGRNQVSVLKESLIKSCALCEAGEAHRVAEPKAAKRGRGRRS